VAGSGPLPAGDRVRRRSDPRNDRSTC